MVERVPSGIDGLDKFLSGGFVKGSNVLVAGKSGTLKTSFCLSYLYEGAKRGEPGVYVSTEETEDDLIEDAKAMFGWDLREQVNKKMIKFVSMVPPYSAKETSDVEKLIKAYVNDVISSIASVSQEIGAKRIVIDSVSMIEMFIQNRYMSRIALMSILRNMKSLGATTMVTEGVPEKQILTGDEALVEFVVDAVIKLDFVPSARDTRTLTVAKMRRTNHSTLIHPFSLFSGGLRLMEIK